MKSRGIIVMVLVAMLSLGGCVRVAIGDKQPTIGDQLVDLYQAREIGAITDAEFSKLRTEILRSLAR